MFKLDSDQDLRAAFRPKDLKLFEPPPPELRPPLFVRDYLAWPHPAGGRVFLIFAVGDGAPTGIVFDSSGGGVASVPSMCDWCHCASVGTGVALAGMLLEVCMRRTYGKDPLYGLLLTFGAALVIEELIRLAWGSGEKQLPVLMVSSMPPGRPT